MTNPVMIPQPIKLRIPNHKWKRIPKPKRDEVREWLRECERKLAVELDKHWHELMVTGSTVVGGRSFWMQARAINDHYGSGPAQDALSAIQHLGKRLGERTE